MPGPSRCILLAGRGPGFPQIVVAACQALTVNMTMTLLTGGGLLALGGFAVALIDTVRDKDRHHHEKELAREARRQDRLDEAYLQLGIYLARHEDWARSVRPFWGKYPAPDPMPPGVRWRIQAHV